MRRCDAPLHSHSHARPLSTLELGSADSARRRSPDANFRVACLFVRVRSVGLFVCLFVCRAEWCRYRKLFVCSLLGGLSSALIPLAFWLHTGDSHFFVQGVRMCAVCSATSAVS